MLPQTFPWSTKDTEFEWTIHSVEKCYLFAQSVLYVVWFLASVRHSNNIMKSNRTQSAKNKCLPMVDKQHSWRERRKYVVLSLDKTVLHCGNCAVTLSLNHDESLISSTAFYPRGVCNAIRPPVSFLRSRRLLDSG